MTTEPHAPDATYDASLVSFSRRGFGKRLLLGASALAVLLAAGKREEAQAAPITDDWHLGGNDGVSADGTNFLGTKNVAPLIFKTAAAANTPLERMRITPAGDVGIGVTSPGGKLEARSPAWGIIGRHTATTGSHSGVYGDTVATVATASGVQGVVRSTEPGVDSAGVLGKNNGTNSNGAGVRGSHAGSGRGVHGTAGPLGTGVYGTSPNHGVRGASAFIGVFGDNDNFQSGYGVYGISGGGDGVVGVSASGTGVHGTTRATDNTKGGVVGVSTGLNTSGVIGEANNGSLAVGVLGKSGSGFAGYFIGKTHVQGTLSKSAGSFKIDHPVEPATKYLSHSFVESPDMMNVYNGNAVLDQKGEATVEMPAYFEALNRDFRYQLTPIGAAAILYIAEEISGARFKIAGGQPGMKVSWQVTGIRQDAFANANRIPVEEDKTAEERGKYLHPKEHGKPESANINATRLQKREEKTSQPLLPPNQ